MRWLDSRLRGNDVSRGSTDFWPEATLLLEGENRPIVGALASEVNTNGLSRLHRTDIRPTQITIILPVQVNSLERSPLPT